jgi:hypothetical protein
LAGVEWIVREERVHVGVFADISHAAVEKEKKKRAVRFS